MQTVMKIELDGKVLFFLQPLCTESQAGKKRIHYYWNEDWYL